MIYAREKAEKAQKSRKQIRWLIGKMANINSTVAFTTEKVDISLDATFVDPILLTFLVNFNFIIKLINMVSQFLH